MEFSLNTDTKSRNLFSLVSSHQLLKIIKTLSTFQSPSPNECTLISLIIPSRAPLQQFIDRLQTEIKFTTENISNNSSVLRVTKAVHSRLIALNKKGYTRFFNGLFIFAGIAVNVSQQHLKGYNGEPPQLEVMCVVEPIYPVGDVMIHFVGNAFKLKFLDAFAQEAKQNSMGIVMYTRCLQKSNPPFADICIKYSIS